MGLLGKSLGSKFKDISKQAVSRIAMLNNKCQVRGSFARSDVVQFLNLGCHDKALLRVEPVSKRTKHVSVLRRSKKQYQALSLHHLDVENFQSFKRLEIFTFRFGKEFAAHAVELHQNNRVNSKMIQKLSARRPAMEIRLKVLKDIGILQQKLELLCNWNKTFRLANEQEEEEQERTKSSTGNYFMLTENTQQFSEYVEH